MEVETGKNLEPAPKPGLYQVLEFLRFQLLSFLKNNLLDMLLV